MSINFLITILVSRYLGPKNFGILAYANSMVGLFATAGHIGLSGLVVREIVKYPQDRAAIMGTSFALKSLGILTGFVALIFTTFFLKNEYSTEFWILLIVSTSMLFQPLNVIDFWFQAHVQSKYIAIVNTAALFISGIFQITLITLGAELLPFAFTNLLHSAVIAVFLVLFYQLKANVPIKSWLVSIEKAKELFRNGWIIYLGSIFAIIYLKVDLIMLRWLSGAEEVGIYSVAVKLSEVWYFLPTAIIASLFPKLIQLRESDLNHYRRRLQQVFDLLFTLAFIVAIAITIFAQPLISLAFGKEYLDSVAILNVHIWSGLFIFMRAAFSKWILIENAIIFSLITQGLGGLSNIILNLVLIPKLGGYGAAIATFLSYAIASYLSLSIYKPTRQVFWMMSKSLLLVPTFGQRYWSIFSKNIVNRL
ncbi:MAG: flippase [Richelia sp. RM2_1_2]|nr:flippase [Richelia sp. RM2_1_2]